ncbi:branched-chain amino acid aminotransferase [Embleya sp. NBC_00888]|uniref:branched-chain amino acid aminotransferase n=1 Tax=Embleya sp. NBC_00888 TaxID=2975960 RepID=UPI00386DC689|nr:branched-chain amino acid aminotransferase [Embleya sp. NBC_00888]
MSFIGGIDFRPLQSRISAQERAARCASPAFGHVFTEHMVSMSWSRELGWNKPELVPYGPLELDPATVGLHYGQVVFEGLKAFRTDDDRIFVFRPEAHARRFRRSAQRLMIPEFPDELFVRAVDALVYEDRAWIPDDPNVSLYLRPILFASEAALALRPAHEYRFLLMAFVTEGFFGQVPRPLTVWATTEYSRAATGGTGESKCAGNYAGTYLAQEQAAREGCDQVVWLDSVERRWVEELGGMNLFFVHGRGDRARLTTPPLTGTLLPGVTRDALLVLAADLGLAVTEEPITLDQWRRGCLDGEISEAFACGTAAGISSIGTVRTASGSWNVGDGAEGAVTAQLSRLLLGIRRGELPDPHHWMHPVGPAVAGRREQR